MEEKAEIKQRQIDNSAYDSLIKSGVSPLLARIFAARGVQSVSDLDYSLSKLPPVAELKGAKEIASLLADAIEHKKKIVVVADYDSDGATSCAVAVRGLKSLGAQVDFLVPNRFEYGYGLTPEIVHLAHSTKSPDIILTVDNGIASIAGVEEANRLQIDVYITDHHLPGDTLPNAKVIVNPNQPGCAFPSKNLAGVGVMFYTLLALRAEMRARKAFEKSPEPNFGALLDLVALGTVADVVKLDRVNSILVHNGLQRMRVGTGSSIGIKSIMDVAKKPIQKAAVYDMGFVVGPRLNAAGRLDDMSIGIRCLITDSHREAMDIAAELDRLNKERREIEADIQDSALKKLDSEIAGMEDRKIGHSIVMYHPDWHQGVIGIVASRIKERFNRPTIVFANAGGGDIKGSGRSISGLHLRDAIDLVYKKHPSLIEKFGGHAMAAGITIKESNLERFKNAFETSVRSLLNEEDLKRVIQTDGAVDSTQLTVEVAKSLSGYIWGQGFPEPVFEGDLKVVDQKILAEKHSKFTIESDDKKIEAIKFSYTEPVHGTIRAVYRLGVNEWNGNEKAQLLIDHIAPSCNLELKQQGNSQMSREEFIRRELAKEKSINETRLAQE